MKYIKYAIIAVTVLLIVFLAFGMKPDKSEPPKEAQAVATSAEEKAAQRKKAEEDKKAAEEKAAEEKAAAEKAAQEKGSADEELIARVNEAVAENGGSPESFTFINKDTGQEWLHVDVYDDTLTQARMRDYAHATVEAAGKSVDNIIMMFFTTVLRPDGTFEKDYKIADMMIPKETIANMIDGYITSAADQAILTIDSDVLRFY